MGPAGNDYVPMALSGDGSTIVGFRPLSGPSFISNLAQGFRLLDEESRLAAPQAFNVSHDGRVVVGTSDSLSTMHGRTAFHWDHTTSTYQDLGVLPGMRSSLAHAVSAEGSAVAGWSAPGWEDLNSNSQAFRWTAQEGMQALPCAAGDHRALAFGISADGSTVVGASLGASTGAARWRNGAIEVLAVPSGTTKGAARATSADGDVSVGAVGIARDDGSSVERAVLWTPRLGVVDLNQYLPTIGVELDGFILHRAYAVSDDGRTIVGEGWHDDSNRTQVYAFVVTLHPRCGTSDFNNDADPGTDADIDAFFLCLAGSCCPACGSADFNADGDTGTDADIESFFRVLGGGSC